MSGRFCLLGSSRTLGTLSLVACVALTLRSASALAQSATDAPLAPTAPPVAPPAPDPPAPAPSVPGPPSDAPPVIEPTPAPTPGGASPAPTPPADGAAPKSELPAAGSAAFAPLPEEAAQPAKPAAAAATAAAASAHADAAPSAPPKPISHAAPPASKDDDSGGLLGPFRIGVLVGTGLPEVANFGAQIKLTRFFGAGVNVGVIPTVKLKFYGEAEQKYQEYDVYGHIYPFGGSFFLGAGVGYAQIDGTLFNRFTVANQSIDVTSDATVRTLVLTPQIGFLKIFDVGFAVGFDLGGQIPIAPSEVHFNTVAAGIPPELADMIKKEYINPNDEKVRHTLETLGRTPLPTFNFKIGWFL